MLVYDGGWGDITLGNLEERVNCGVSNFEHNYLHRYGNINYSPQTNTLCIHHIEELNT